MRSIRHRSELSHSLNLLHPVHRWLLPLHHVLRKQLYTTNNLGDVTGDGAWNILDIVTLAACVLNGNCADLAYSQNTDLNQDGTVNILDIVILSMCVLHIDCGSL